jgi:hypothetical protein
MAKKTAAQVNQEQSLIPLQHREAMRVSEDGKHTFVTFSLPRYLTILIRKTDTVEIDTAKIDGASRLLSVFLYGVGRKMRDGALTRMVEKDSAGNVTERKLSDAEKRSHAMSHAEMRREWLYGEREQQTRGGVDAETQECRAAVVSYMCNTLGYTAKSVPSTIAKALSVADVEQGAKQEGVPAKAVKALIKKGRAIAELRSEDIEIDLD